MLNPETLVQIYRQTDNRKAKALGVNALRWLGMRHLVIRMDTINLCNLRCQMCYYSAVYDRKKEEMDPALFSKIASEVFPRTRFLYLSCATEPTVNKRFAEVVRITGEHKVPFTSFCTNGQLLSAEIVQASIEAKLSEIIFSVDGATKETYEHIRRGARWERLIERMDMLAQMKRQAGSALPQARVNFTCMMRNIRELPALVHFCADHGVERLHVRHLLEYQDEQNTCKDELRYVQVFNAVAEEAKREAQSRDIGLFLPDAAPATAAPRAGSCGAGGGRTEEANRYCVLPWFHGIISWKGDYRVCTTNTIGNLREQSFEELYHGPKMREIRRRMLWNPRQACSWDCNAEAHHIADEAADSQQLSLDPK